MPRKYRILLAVVPLVLLLDQATKFAAVQGLTDAFERNGAQSLSARLAAFARLENLDNQPFALDGVDYRRAPVTVVEGFWNHRYVENPGAAWGMLGNVTAKMRLTFFHLMSVAALVFLLAFVRRLDPAQWPTALALALVTGGALGNWVDRALRGYVIDFIDWHLRGHHWPTFNIADAAISSGVVLLLAEPLWRSRLAAKGQAGSVGLESKVESAPVGE